MEIPRIVLAGSTSGVGKTIISCGLVHALKRHGYSVQPFKVGPDYIDPSYLSGISGHDTCNLDSWLMGSSKVLESFVSNSNCNVSVIEGVMGFYDGFAGDSNLASTHHVASITKSPVILVLDASKTSRSVAAMAMGFKKFHKNSRICGVILNRLGSKKHESLCRQALAQTGLPVFGAVYRNPELIFESRHLGLVPAVAENRIQKRLISASRAVSDSLDMPRITAVLRAATPLPKAPRHKIKKSRVTISVALDSSFNFYYRDNLDALQREGAALKFFSPIRDKRPPDSDGIYIGGGFPEVLGCRLERNHSMRKAIRNFSEAGMPIYAECGGLMYLTRSIHYGRKKYRMAGIFDADTQMTKKMTLGYTKGRMVSNSIISSKPKTFRGHEFHYSELRFIPNDSRFAYDMDIGTGIKNNRDGMMLGNTLASYGHLYFNSANYAAALVDNCRSFSRR